MISNIHIFEFQNTFSGSWLHPMSVPRGRAGKPNMTKMVRNAVIMTKIAMVMIWHRLRQETVAAPKVSTSLRIHTIARWVSSFERFQTMAGIKYLRQRPLCLFSTTESFTPPNLAFLCSISKFAWTVLKFKRSGARQDLSSLMWEFLNDAISLGVIV